jgi:hypothetical protein
MTTEFSYHYLPYCFSVFFLFFSMFLLSVHGEIEQEEDYSNMDIYGNIFHNNIEDEILDTEPPVPMNTTELIEIGKNLTIIYNTQS